MMIVLLTLNAVLALVSGASAVLGALRPAIGVPAGESVTAGVRLYARAYALRAAPLSLVALVLMAMGTPTAGLTPTLVVLGVAQAGDSVIGFSQRNWGMTVTASVGAIVHLTSAVLLATM